MLKPIVLLLLFINSQFIFSQEGLIGKWKTLHEDTGKPVSIVEFYNSQDKVFGKIVEILEKEHENDLCHKCKGAEKNKPVKGLTIVKNMEKIDDEYKNGTIFHPVLGKNFKCKIRFVHENRIQVRGYLLFFYGTQYWERITE